MSTIYAVDLFCGAGGASTGLKQAVEPLGHKLHLTAVDQWDVAMETHARNHPKARHIRANVNDFVGSYQGPRNINLLWASPPCTDHSPARGGNPRSEESQDEAWSIVRLARKIAIEKIIVENVPESMPWGALDADGYPIPSRTGERFLQFVGALQSLGYCVESNIICAANYGDPTTRRRLFLQAAKSTSGGAARISWPNPTHLERPNVFALPPWRPAREIIDSTIPGNPISRRVLPLSKNTMRRIDSGIRKYWREKTDPFLVSLRGTSDCQIASSPARITRPLRTVSAGGVHEALIAHSDNDGITFRMLQPHELAAAQGFPAEYIFSGTMMEKVKQVGNAVPVNTAAALCRAALGGGI